MTRRHSFFYNPGEPPRRLGYVLIAGSCMGLACDAGGDDFIGEGAPNALRPASGAAGSGGRSASDEPSRDAPRDAVARAVLDAGSGSVDRNVFRPEERPATPALIATLQAPRGFSVAPFAQNLDDARMLAARGPFVYVTRPNTGDVLRLEDADRDSAAEVPVSVVEGLPLVHGIAFRGDQVYLATPTQVLLASVDASGGFTSPSVIIDGLPDGGQHPLRTLAISPSDQLFISIGSSCDACPESNPEHATLLAAALDGSSRSTFASGLRNTIGFAWHPETGALFGMDHGSDWRGDDLPPEELNAIEAGSNYGWPYCYGDRQIDPVIQDPPEGTKAEYCAPTAGPVLSTQAHNAPIGLTFAAGTNFPSEYRDDAFVAMHGSWNRYPPTGYKVVRVVFEAGVPERFEDFVTGFLIEDGAATFGRPAGITVAPDGSLLFGDDSNGIIYRVSFDGAAVDAGAAEPPPAPEPPVLPEPPAPAPLDAGVSDAG